jgi:hypothetical protein
MLGLFLLSIASVKRHVAAVGRSVVVSVFVVLLINEPQLMNPLFGTAFSAPLLAWPWLFPIGALCCFGLSIRGKREEVMA